MSAGPPGRPAPNWDAIPPELAQRPQWLLWRFEVKRGQSKPLKVPYWTTGVRRSGVQGSDGDRAKLVTLEQARLAYDQGGYSGVGFAFLPGDGLIGIDIDGAIDPETGEVSQRLQAIIEAVASYTEYSPSGRGAHIIAMGETTTNKSNEIGLEIFAGRQYFTCTGHHWPGTPQTVEPIGEEALRRLNITVNDAKARRKLAPGVVAAQPGAAELRTRVESALESLNPDMGYNDWIAIGWALREAFGEFGFGLWSAWSARGDKYQGDSDLQSHWKSFTCSRAPEDAVGVIFARARDAGWKAPRRAAANQAVTSDDLARIDADLARYDAITGGSEPPQSSRDGPSPLAPPVMAADGFPDLVREVVEAACANSEAHSVAVAANVIALFCCAVGRGPFQRIGDSVVHNRAFALVVGKSGKARKGTAENTPREVFRRADAILRKRHQSNDRLRIHAGGLSTGEGVAWAIRDAREPDAATGKGGDLGVNDKRLMVIESEFANVLAQVKREGNILSATIRNLWDGRDIEPLTKTSQMTATRPHVVIIGHITGHELREKSTENDAANGLMNRFMILHVHRPKLVPLPEPTPDAVLDKLAQSIAAAIDYATKGDPHGNNTHEIVMTPEARDLWCELYPQITRDLDGKAGSLMARSEVYARMLAMVFCLMDQRREIEPCDLRAALAWVEYWHQSITYVFLTGDDEPEVDSFTTAVLELVGRRPGIKLSELQEAWHRKQIPAVRASLEKLLNMAPPAIEMRKDTSTGGRVAQRYYPVGA
jgi:hypothetical protein